MKLGQMKIQQTAFVLIAVTLFFVLVGLFVFTFKFSGLKESATMLAEENAMMLVTKLANSPEFSCGESFGETRVNCVDSDKIMVLKDNADYNGFWKVSKIEVRKIYPKTEEVICTDENYPNCNVITVYSDNSQGFDVSNFVSLCRKESSEEGVYDKCEVAKIIIGYEKK